jgi:rubrerythrin
MNVSLFRQHLALKHRHYVTEQDDRQPEYRAYFNGMMKKHGYDSPADIPDDKKKAFFDAVDKGYTAKNESTTLKEDKKSDAWECMHCGNIFRTQHGARQCPKCHNENIVLGKFISGRA